MKQYWHVMTNKGPEFTWGSTPWVVNSVWLRVHHYSLSKNSFVALKLPCTPGLGCGCLLTVLDGAPVPGATDNRVRAWPYTCSPKAFAPQGCCFLGCPLSPASARPQPHLLPHSQDSFLSVTKSQSPPHPPTHTLQASSEFLSSMTYLLEKR